MLPQEIKDMISKNGLKIGIIIILVIAGIMTVSIFHLPNDNPIEEACEATIEQLTGVKVDLTPDEKKE